MPDPHALFQQALALHQAGNLERAVSLYRVLLDRFPRNADLLYLSGTAESQRGNHAAGIALLNRSLRINPGNSEAHNNRGMALAELGQLDDARQSFARAVEANPNNAGAWTGLADTLSKLARHDEALLAYRHALELDPANPQLHFLAGSEALALGRYDEALASFEQATRWQPDFGEAYWNQALLKLALGDFTQGWRLYEWRWKASRQKEYFRGFPHPLWLGQPSIAGKTILVHAEAGLGDSIQFCRYVPMIERLGANIILEVQSALATLAPSLACRFTVVHGGAEIPDFEVQCPMMSLPLAFGTTLGTIPAEVPYLHADVRTREHWRARLGAQHAPRIGLMWAGSTEHANDRNRSIELRRLLPLLELPFEFHSLQKEYRASDAPLLAQLAQIRDHRDQLRDLSDTAALIAEMDLVIAVDTAIAHLAGALGKRVWILLPFVADFRWLVGRSDSPWYPTARLFRQPATGDWESVVRTAAGELAREFLKRTG